MAVTSAKVVVGSWVFRVVHPVVGRIAGGAFQEGPALIAVLEVVGQCGAAALALWREGEGGAVVAVLLVADLEVLGSGEGDAFREVGADDGDGLDRGGAFAFDVGEVGDGVGRDGQRGVVATHVDGEGDLVVGGDVGAAVAAR